MTTRNGVLRSIRNRPVVLAALVALAAGVVAIGAPAIAADDPVTQDEVEIDQNHEIDVTLEHAGGTGLVPGEAQQYELVVEGADAGVQAYDGLIEIEDTDVASFTDVEITAEDAGDEGPFDNSEVVDESTLDLETALGAAAFDGGDEVVIAEVFIETDDGLGPGDEQFTVEEWDLTVSEMEVLNDDGEIYAGEPTIDSQELGLFDFGDDGNLARDNNGDGLVGDITGNEEVDSGDALTLFFNRDIPEIDANPEFFSFGEDPRDIQSIDSGNALTLFFERNIRDAGQIP